MTSHVTSRYQGLNSSEVGAKIENLATRLQCTEIVKAVFHFNRIVPKGRVFLCFLNTKVELMTSIEKKMLRYVTIKLM